MYVHLITSAFLIALIAAYHEAGGKEDWQTKQLCMEWFQVKSVWLWVMLAAICKRFLTFHQGLRTIPMY